jgi:hypothetical protein
LKEEINRRNEESSKIIFGELLNNVDNIIPEFINIGYIHPEVKKAVVGLLKLMPTIIQD